MSKTLSDATPNVFQFQNGEKMKHPNIYGIFIDFQFRFEINLSRINSMVGFFSKISLSVKYAVCDSVSVIFSF